jgi:phospholipid/cholesterol/gamma-HCH transport system permease protein
MADRPGWIKQSATDGGLELAAGGVWTIAGAAALEKIVRELSPGAARQVRFELSGISALDTAGVWLLRRTAKMLRWRPATHRSFACESTPSW